MKIGIFDPYLDDGGGGEKYMMNIASILAKKHIVTVFWDNPKDVELVKRRFAIDVSRIHLGTNIFSSRISTWQRLVITSNFDAIIFLSNGGIPLVASKKLFIHVQQPINDFDIHSLIGRLKVKRITRLFCNSEFTKDHIASLISCPMGVIYPPVDIHLKQVKKEKIILHVGRFRMMDPLSHSGDFKKQSFMIDTFAQMVNMGLSGWKLVMAVSVKPEDMHIFKKVEATAKDLPINFAVNKTNEELWGLYNRAKIYWHASGFGEDLKTYPERAEHFGISTVEAMGAGAVPVVINAGGQKEIVVDGENGFLWNTQDEFINKTKNLMNDEDLWQRLSSQAKLQVENFSAQQFERQVLGLVAS